LLKGESYSLSTLYNIILFFAKRLFLKLFEVKYSTRKDGSEFFGTVMFTELFEAINNENNLENWFYKIFSVSEFLKFCTLTTPIGHYRIRFNENKEILKTNVGIRGVKITKNMILDIWKKYREWKP